MPDQFRRSPPVQLKACSMSHANAVFKAKSLHLINFDTDLLAEIYAGHITLVQNFIKTLDKNCTFGSERHFRSSRDWRRNIFVSVLTTQITTMKKKKKKTPRFSNTHL
jgi:hypothetical protein